MSYILEALKKVEQERTIGKVPGIASGYEPSGRAGSSPWVWVLVGVLVVNALLLVIALWPQKNTDTVTKQVENQHVFTPPAAPEPAASPPRTAAPVKQVASVKPVSKDKPPVALRPLPPLPEPVPIAEVETPVAKVTGAGDQAGPQPVVETESRNNNLPVWPQVSSRLFQQINSGLRLDVHVYSKLPEERFVLINMQRYREGEQLQEGPVVDEITPSEVILSFRGQRFRVQ